MAYAHAAAIEKIPNLSSSEAFILYRLADRANGEGFCWPSTALLAKETRLARRTIFDILNSLESMGLIERQKVKGRANGYCLTFEKALSDGVTRPEKDRWRHTAKREEEKVPTFADFRIKMKESGMTTKEIYNLYYQLLEEKGTAHAKS